MSELQVLRNASGDHIAFRMDRYLLDTDRRLIGWFPYSDQPDVAVRGGTYIGEVVDGDRLFRRDSTPSVSDQGMPSDPGYVADPGYIASGSYSSTPGGMSDVPRDLLRP